MRSRSASAAATSRRAIRGRAARESRARKRTLLSRPRPPPGPLAPFVARAPLTAGPPREPLPLALTFACSARPSERTDLALSTRLASRRSTGTSLRVLARAPHGSLQPVLVLGCNGPYPTSASACERTVSCRSGCGRDRRAPESNSCANREVRPHAARRVRLPLRTPAEARRVVDPGESRAIASRQERKRRDCGPALPRWASRERLAMRSR
jgi:hypothetical protein